MDYSVYARLYMSTLIPIGPSLYCFRDAVPHAKCAVQRARAAPKRDGRARRSRTTRNICDARPTAALLAGFLAYPTRVRPFSASCYDHHSRCYFPHVPLIINRSAPTSGLAAAAWCAALVLSEQAFVLLPLTSIPSITFGPFPSLYTWPRMR